MRLFIHVPISEKNILLKQGQYFECVKNYQLYLYVTQCTKEFLFYINLWAADIPDTEWRLLNPTNGWKSLCMSTSHSDAERFGQYSSRPDSPKRRPVGLRNYNKPPRTDGFIHSQLNLAKYDSICYYVVKIIPTNILFFSLGNISTFTFLNKLDHYSLSHDVLQTVKRFTSFTWCRRSYLDNEQQHCAAYQLVGPGIQITLVCRCRCSHKCYMICVKNTIASIIHLGWWYVVPKFRGSINLLSFKRRLKSLPRRCR